MRVTRIHGKARANYHYSLLKYRFYRTRVCYVKSNIKSKFRIVAMFVIAGLTNSISHMTSYSYACDVSVPNFTRLAPKIHLSSPRTRVPYQNFISHPYNFIFHHPSRKNIKKLQSTVSKVAKRELHVAHIYMHETMCATNQESN
jgi:hypothetical protein